MRNARGRRGQVPNCILYCFYAFLATARDCFVVLWAPASSIPVITGIQLAGAECASKKSQGILKMHYNARAHPSGGSNPQFAAERCPGALLSTSRIAEANSRPTAQGPEVGSCAGPGVALSGHYAGFLSSRRVYCSPASREERGEFPNLQLHGFFEFAASLVLTGESGGARAAPELTTTLGF